MTESYRAVLHYAVKTGKENKVVWKTKWFEKRTTARRFIFRVMKNGRLWDWELNETVGEK